MLPSSVLVVGSCLGLALGSIWWYNGRSGIINVPVVSPGNFGHNNGAPQDREVVRYVRYSGRTYEKACVSLLVRTHRIAPNQPCASTINRHQQLILVAIVLCMPISFYCTRHLHEYQHGSYLLPAKIARAEGFRRLPLSNGSGVNAIHCTRISF